MMARNPNWWSLNGMHPKFDHRLSSQSVYPFTSPLSSIPSPPDDCRHSRQDFPVRSRSQLLLGGLAGGGLLREQKNLGNWDDEMLNLNPSLTRVPVVDAKQEVARSSFQHYGHVGNEFQDHRCRPPQQVLPVSISPIITSCTDISCNNILNFSDGKCTTTELKNQKHSHDLTSECNRTSAGGVSKRARVQQSSAQPALKVRKEKLGDRIAALHQLVSPFGKTDTASVLSEAIGYISFLQGQIEELVSPHMRKAAASTGHHHQHSLNKFLNDNGMERGAPKQDSQLGLSAEVVKDLRSRGLCLVPISCTQHVANDSGAADCWAPAAVGGGF